MFLYTPKYMEENQMTKEEFIRLVTEHVLEYLPESYQGKQVEVTKRAKNNDIIRHGLTIGCQQDGFSFVLVQTVLCHINSPFITPYEKPPFCMRGAA